jgi:hypothetical protein
MDFNYLPHPPSLQAVWSRKLPIFKPVQQTPNCANNLYFYRASATECPSTCYFIRCLHTVLNVLVQIANKMGLKGGGGKKKNIYCWSVNNKTVMPLTSTCHRKPIQAIKQCCFTTLHIDGIRSRRVSVGLVCLWVQMSHILYWRISLKFADTFWFLQDQSEDEFLLCVSS